MKTKITIERDGQTMTLELHDDNDIDETVNNLKLILHFIGYSQELINDAFAERL